jgi:hypothetical protein
VFVTVPRIPRRSGQTLDKGTEPYALDHARNADPVASEHRDWVADPVVRAFFEPHGPIQSS